MYKFKKKTIEKGYLTNILTSDEVEILCNKSPRISNFYMLPKIHKENTPSRPTVNSIGSITEKMSTYVDETLKQLSKQVPSYVKDITHFLNIIKDLEINETEILCTRDISSLYTNIPHLEGIEAI